MGSTTQRTSWIVTIHHETGGSFSEHSVAAVDEFFARGASLIDSRLAAAQLNATDFHHQIAGCIGRDGIGAVKSQADLCRIRAGAHDEIVFQVARASVENYVDAGINISVPNLGELGDIRMPVTRIAPDKVIAHPGAPLFGFHARRGIRTGKPEIQNRSRGFPVAARRGLENSSALRQPKRGVRGVCQVLHTCIGLAHVRLKDDTAGRDRYRGRQRQRRGKSKARGRREELTEMA